ncbi:MAG: Crp/Fnr family transcriptional regulator [Candidatus Xenobiia bacterium LiM19]
MKERITDAQLSLLKQCILFRRKAPDEIDCLLSETKYFIQSFRENDIVLSPVETADRIGIILSGTVDVQKIFPSGNVVIIERKKSTDIIGEPSVFSEYEFYQDTYAASEACKILFIGKKALIELLTGNNDIMCNFVEYVSNSILLLKHKIGILSLDSIKEKIAGFLIHNIRHCGNTVGSNIITLPFSKKAWAEFMNVSRTSLSRELRKLESDGIISFHRRTIEIKEAEKLERILSE